MFGSEAFSDVVAERGWGERRSIDGLIFLT